MKSSRHLRGVVLLAAVAGCGLASAGDQAPLPPAVTVSYADLNLRSPAGIAGLYRRLERAAAGVCSAAQGTRQLKIESQIKACRHDALDRAVVQANLPALNELHLAKTGCRIEPARYADR